MLDFNPLSKIENSCPNICNSTLKNKSLKNPYEALHEVLWWKKNITHVRRSLFIYFGISVVYVTQYIGARPSGSELQAQLFVA